SQGKKSAQNYIGARDFLVRLAKQLRAGNESNAHHGADEAINKRAGTERVANVDGNERAEGTEHKHGHAHRQKNKSQAGMGKDGLVAGKEVFRQRRNSLFRMRTRLRNGKRG